MIGDNLWKAGKEEFEKKDVIAIRIEAEHRRTKKAQVWECILHDIHDQKEAVASILMSDDMNYMPSWQSYIRHHANNLRLNMMKQW